MTVEIQAKCDEMGLTVTSVFIPWSRSRNYAAETNLSRKTLNWRVTLLHNSLPVISTDYSAGIAHCPAYRPPTKEVGRGMSLIRSELLEYEIETGKIAKHYSSVFGITSSRKPIEPNSLDVLYSLLMDSAAIDYRCFSNWAESYGYNTDSRKAKSIYRACIDIGLKLRAGIGDENIAKLHLTFQDY